MADIHQRLRDEINEQVKALGRRPRVLLIQHPRVEGVCLEDHENGLVLGGATQQSLEPVVNEVTKQVEIQVNNIPTNSLSPKLFWLAEERVFVAVEVERSAIVTPTKRLVVPG